MKKIKLGILLILAVLVVTGCSCERKTESFTVAFDTNGGNTIESVNVEKDQTVAKPVDPKKDGYTFIGWYLNLDDTTTYDFSTKVTRNITLYAKWSNNSGEEISYTVTFNSNGGSFVKSQTVKDGERASKPTNPTRSGYTFAGWQLNNSIYNFNSPVTKNITLYAKWTKNSSTNKPTKPEEEVKKYTVTFVNDGKTIKTVTVEDGKKVSAISAPTKDGYTFKGWTLDGKTYDFNKAVSGDITLSASWEKVEPKLTYEIVNIDNSVANQAKIYILADGVRVDGYADITTKSGKVVRVKISKNGFVENAGIIKNVTNINLEK